MQIALIQHGKVHELFPLLSVLEEGETPASRANLNAALDVRLVADAVDQGWLVDGETISPPPTDRPPEAVTAEARTLLAIADQTVMRCMRKGVPVTGAWNDYMDALADIAASGEEPGAWPERPDYPPGS